MKVLRPPDLAVDITPSTIAPSVGSALDFTIDGDNVGSQPTASGAVITVSLPAKAVYSVTTVTMIVGGAPGLCTSVGSPTENKYECAVGNLDACTHVSISVTGSVVSAGNLGASASGSTTNDANTTNNTDATVLNINMPPDVTAPDWYDVPEDVPLDLSLVGVADSDSAGLDETLQLTVAHGTLRFLLTTGLTLDAGANFSKTVTYRGTIAELNDALLTLSYTPDAEFSGDDTLTLVLNDLGNSGAGGALSDTANVDLHVHAINDAPVATVPGSKTLVEDGSFTFSGADNLSVSDVDAGAGYERLDLLAVHGTLTLASTSGLLFMGGTANGQSAVVVVGTLADLNAALDGLVYRPSPDFNGEDTLSMAINDLGNTGLGGFLSDSDTVALTVSAANDAPDVSAPASL